MQLSLMEALKEAEGTPNDGINGAYIQFKHLVFEANKAHEVLSDIVKQIIKYVDEWDRMYREPGYTYGEKLRDENSWFKFPSNMIFNILAQSENFSPENVELRDSNAWRIKYNWDHFRKIIQENLDSLIDYAEKDVFPEYGEGLTGIIRHYLYEAKDPNFEEAYNLIWTAIKLIHNLVPEFHKSNFNGIVEQFHTLFEEDFGK